MTPPIKLTRNDIIDQAKAMGCDPAVIQAVCDVESAGGGFLPDGRPKILFERHLFHRFTNGQFDDDHPNISNPSPGGYGLAGANQYDRMHEAAVLDRIAALRATSWGMFQCLGDNFKMLKYTSVEAMVSDFYIGERQHLVGFRLFCDAANCTRYLRPPPNFPAFARVYNGPNYAASGYHSKLEAAYRKRVTENWTRVDSPGDTPPPAIENVKAVDIRVEGIKYIQKGLALLNLYSGEIDGKRGPLTNAALSKAWKGQY